MLVGSNAFYLKFGSTDPVAAKSPIFNKYSLILPQPLHLAKQFT